MEESRIYLLKVKPTGPFLILMEMRLKLSGDFFVKYYSKSTAISALIRSSIIFDSSSGKVMDQILRSRNRHQINSACLKCGQ